MVVTQNIGSELDNFKDKLNDKIDDSLSDYERRLAELEELYKSLSNKNLSIAPLDREKTQVLSPKDIIRRQTRNGYFEVPWDCYLEASLWGYNTALWINVPDDNPNKQVIDFFNKGFGTRNNWWLIIASMNKWKLLECNNSQIISNSTIVSKGDHIVLTWGWNLFNQSRYGHEYGYWKPLDDTTQLGNMTHWGADDGAENSLSYIKLTPFKS